MGEENVINRAEWPQTIDSIKEGLFEIGLEKGMTVLVHSSLSSMGWVCGGAVAVICALQSVLGKSGSLVMPVHSGQLSDPKYWASPPVPEKWWPTIRENMPPFYKDITPSRGMGEIAECFRKTRGALRSDHPHYSFCAWGRHARKIIGRHSLEFGLGEASPLSTIYRLGGHVLLLGVSHSSNTSLHLAEYRADYPDKKKKVNSAPIVIRGKRIWADFEDIDLSCNDFEDIGKEFKNYSRTLREEKIALAQSQFFSQKELVDFAVNWMEENR